jgi:hypothetical protein
MTNLSVTPVSARPFVMATLAQPLASDVVHARLNGLVGDGVSIVDNEVTVYLPHASSLVSLARVVEALEPISDRVVVSLSSSTLDILGD